MGFFCSEKFVKTYLNWRFLWNIKRIIEFSSLRQSILKGKLKPIILALIAIKLISLNNFEISLIKSFFNWKIEKIEKRKILKD